MPTMDLDASVRAVCERDPRFRREAYHFLLEALDFTLTRRAREAGTAPPVPGAAAPGVSAATGMGATGMGATGMAATGMAATGSGATGAGGAPRAPGAPAPSNVTGRDLLEGFRDLAIDRFGALAHEVLRVWGITRTDDVGAVVFNMVEAGLLQKTATDSPADYHAVFDFEASLARSFAELLRNGEVRLDGRTVDVGSASEKPTGQA